MDLVWVTGGANGVKIRFLVWEVKWFNNAYIGVYWSNCAVKDRKGESIRCWRKDVYYERGKQISIALSERSGISSIQYR